MKKITFAILICSAISGCADLNQHIEKTANILKELGKKPVAKTETPAPTTTAEVQKTVSETPVTAVKQLTPPNPIEPDNPAGSSSDKKPARLNFTLPQDISSAAITSAPEITQGLTKEIASPAKSADMPATSKPALPKPIPMIEAKTARTPEHISTKELNGHHWQINKIFITNNFKASEDRWLFSFNQNGQYKAFGACNFLSGKFKAADDGTFRLGKLETSLIECPESKDEEVMVFNMLLMADSFAMRDEVLLFKSGDKVMMELIPSNQEINVNMTKKSHQKRDKKSTKIKSGQKKETKKKVGKKSPKEKAAKDNKQKADKSSASKKTKTSQHHRK